MKLEIRLDTLSDDVLLQRLGHLARRQHALTAALLAHIAEVDRRRLYLREACSSMHRYCVERLGLSDGAAYKRIRAARAARRFPLIFEMIERGELHLKGVTLLAPHLREESHRELLARAKHEPVRAIEKLVAELSPRPDVASRVRAIPRGKPAGPAAPEPPIAVEPAAPAPDRPARPQPPGMPNRPAAPQQAAAAPTPSAPAPLEISPPEPLRESAAPRSQPASAAKRPVTPLSPDRYELRITIDQAAHADLEQLQDLLGHQVPDRDPATIISRALALLLERTLARKAAVTDEPRRVSQTARRDKPRSDEPRSRHIPAEVRRLVWRRDGGRCAFRDTSGRRCTARSTLEFHHLDNWARGAGHDPERIELRCRAHNQYQAVLDYGEAFIEAARGKRQSGRHRAREPIASYGATFRRRAPAAAPRTGE